MFRTVTLSIVLTLAVAHNAALLLCTAQCDAHESAPIGCHHADAFASPRVSEGERCDNLALDATAFLRENVRRDISSPDPGHAIPVLRYQLTSSTICARPGHDPAGQWRLVTRPLSIALRI